MFNLGIGEMVAIGIIALVLIGPKQLPEVARTIGRLLNEIRRSTNSLKEEFRNQVQIDRKMFDLDDEAQRKRREAAHQAIINATPEETSQSQVSNTPSDGKKS